MKKLIITAYVDLNNIDHSEFQEMKYKLKETGIDIIKGEENVSIHTLLVNIDTSVESTKIQYDLITI